MTEGIWTSEIMGLFGWETIGILTLEKGRVIGGGVHHYSTGSYEVSGDDVTIEVKVEFYGTPRTIFGASDRSLTVVAQCKLKGNVMEGHAHRVDKPGQNVTYRLTRRADVPPLA